MSTRASFVAPMTSLWFVRATPSSTRNTCMMCSLGPEHKEETDNTPTSNDADSKSSTGDQAPEDQANAMAEEERIAKLKKIRKLMFANRKVKSSPSSPIKAVSAYHVYLCTASILHYLALTSVIPSYILESPCLFYTVHTRDLSWQH